MPVDPITCGVALVATYGVYKYTAHKITTSTMVQESEFLTFEENTESDVVIVLMGWGAAQMRHIAKFQEKYRERNYSILTFLAPLTSILDLGVPASLASCVANRLHEHFEGLSEERRSRMKIFVHAFSNTGYYGMQCLEGMLETDRFAHLNAAYAGRLMDSCPGHTGLDKIKLPPQLAEVLKTRQTIQKGGEENALLQPALYEDFSLSYGEELGLVQKSLKLGDEYDLTYLPHKNLKQAFLISLAAVSCILRKNTYIHPIWTPLTVAALSVLLAKEKLWKAYCHVTGTPKVSLYEHLVNGSLENYNADLDKAARLPKQSTALPPALPGVPLQPAVAPSEEGLLVAAEELQGLMAEVSDDDVEEFKNLTRNVRSFDFLTRKYLNSAALTSQPDRPLPELFLYGPKDALIPDYQVEKVIFARTVQNDILRQEGKQAPALMVCRFADSPHVSHFRTHPEVYFKAVFAFIDKVMKE